MALTQSPPTCPTSVAKRGREQRINPTQKCHGENKHPVELRITTGRIKVANALRQSNDGKNDKGHKHTPSYQNGQQKMASTKNRYEWKDASEQPENNIPA